MFHSDVKLSQIERSTSFGQLNSSYQTNGSVNSSLESPTNVADGFPKPAIFDLSDLTSELPNLNEPMQLYPQNLAVYQAIERPQNPFHKNFEKREMRHSFSSIEINRSDSPRFMLNQVVCDSKPED